LLADFGFFHGHLNGRKQAGVHSLVASQGMAGELRAVPRISSNSQRRE
jgi:hypothetical protein